MNTGTCLRPSCTAMVCPTMSGNTSLRRDHVLMIRFSRLALSCCTFLRRWSSQNGPFFRERLISLLLASTHDHAIGRLVVTGAIAQRGLAPWRLRVATGTGAALATTMGMVEGIHGHATDRGAPAAPARLARLADGLVLMVHVADLA